MTLPSLQAMPVRPHRRAVPWAAEAVLIAALGGLQTLAVVHTAWWWMPLATVAVLVLRLADQPPRRAALLGWCYGTAWLVASTWWIYVSLHRYGGMPAWMAAAAVLALSASLSLYLAAACGLHARWRHRRPARDALTFAALWLLAELARGVIFTGFPWAASGYAQVDAPLAVLAPWLGVYGLGAVAAYWSAWLALSVRRLRVLGVGAAVLALFAVLGPPTSTRPTGTLRVTLIQGNVPQEEKFAAEHQGDALRWHVEQLLGARTDLVVAPETAVPFLPEEMPTEFWPAFEHRFDAGRTFALFGAPQGDERSGYTNSAIGFAPGRPAYRYNKHHLVPFGEFTPWGFHWFTALMNMPLGDFDRGPVVAPSFHVLGERVAPNICYEDLFGEDLAARSRLAEGAPTIYANISNIGWFGPTIAVEQHLNISRMRTLELQRPMLRATNTGATAVVDHHGRVTDRLDPFSRGVLVASVQGRTGDTPFAWWASRWGLWPLLLAALAVVGHAAFTLRRVPRPPVRSDADPRIPTC